MKEKPQSIWSYVILGSDNSLKESLTFFADNLTFLKSNEQMKESAVRSLQGKTLSAYSVAIKSQSAFF